MVERLRSTWAVAAAIGVVCAGPDDGRAWGATSPGYAEINAPPDTTVAVEPPRADPPRAPAPYIIETAPGDASRPAVPPPRPLDATLPAGPPTVVVIRFDGHRADEAASAALIAGCLAGHGMDVREVSGAAPVTADEIGFVFAEDRERALGLVRLLPGSLNRLVPTRVDPRGVADPQPGLIQITLGEDRSTS